MTCKQVAYLAKFNVKTFVFDLIHCYCIAYLEVAGLIQKKLEGFVAEYAQLHCDL